MAPEQFVQTSIARRMIARLRATHERRRISIFSGPPGIGKTTAIDVFRGLHPENVVVVKIARRPAKEVLVLQHALEGFRLLAGTDKSTLPRSNWELRTCIFREVCRWAGLDVDEARRSPSDTSGCRLTFVFDEAQNLSRGAIEVLRYWNDADRCYAPFPIGLVFVGNNEFSLRSDGRGDSAISAAVADRALHVQALEYDDVTDADLEMFLEARGLADRSGIGAVLRYFRTTRVPRSLRRVEDILDDVADLAEGRPITGAMVQEALFVS